MKVKELYDFLNNGRIISDIELQREIVYDTKKQELVIDSIVNSVPLPAFYLWRNDNDILEVLDGKQRIEAIKRFFQNDIEYDGKLWKQINVEIQEKICNTELCIIECTGTDHLRREIFRRINTLGVPLSTYEVLNGLYHGDYLDGLTEFVSRDKYVINVLGANSRGKNQITILKWILALKSANKIDEYVKTNQCVSFELDQKFISPYIRFIKDIFTDKTKIKLDLRFRLSTKFFPDKSRLRDKRDMILKDCNDYIKSDYYKLSNSTDLDIEAIIVGIIGDYRVDKKRFFTKEDKAELIKMRDPVNNMYKCDKCNQHFNEDELTVDHKDPPWSKGGRTVLSNAELLCRPCNSSKGNR